MRKCHWCGVEGHLRKNCPVKEEAVAAANPKGSFKGGERMVKCFNCRKFGHVSMHCPERASYFCGDSRGRSVARAGLVEGTAVSDILLDTGCTCTMVWRDLIPEENLLPGETVTVLCAHGDTALYLLARVKIDVEGLKLEVKAAMSESLPVSALLGTDTMQLGQLLISNPLTIRTPGLEQALVSTRAQSRRQAEEERVEFQQTLLQDRHAFEKALLQEELNLMQAHKDALQEMRCRHLASTIELQYQKLCALHDMRLDHLGKQHASEWDNQLAYSKKVERELRKKRERGQPLPNDLRQRQRRQGRSRRGKECGGLMWRNDLDGPF